MNTLYQGDNLAILRNMPDKSVDLICTDPPFNTGKDWGAFDDRWEGGLDGYLKFMKPRLIECRRVLKDTGSLYLHCDPTASHYLKVMLDGVFGIKQFRGEIVWKRSNANQTNLTNFQIETDRILFYIKSNDTIFNMIYQPLSSETLKSYKYIDDNGRRYAISCGGLRKDQINRKRNKVYLDENKGRKVGDIWIDKSLRLGSVSKERLGYPTQKPLALYARMIKASSNQGDVVLDPFAGSGTTLDAAHTLGRHWIGIDVGDAAIETIQERMRHRHGLEYDRDYQIIRGTEET